MTDVKLLITYVNGNTKEWISKLSTDHLFGAKGYLSCKDWELVGIENVNDIKSVKFINWIIRA